MTIAHHPSEELLLDYASGALSEPWSVAVATHLALCPACRKTFQQMEAVGGAFLDQAPDVAEFSDDFEGLFTGIEQADLADHSANISFTDQQKTDEIIFPEPLREYVGGDVGAVRWQRLGLGAFQSILPTNESSARIRLLRIPASRPVPEHSHRGLELTLVLSGAFSDSTGYYGRGDFQEADQTLEHKPVAAPGEDCVCLAVTDAPLRFRSIAAKIAQPFLGI